MNEMYRETRRLLKTGGMEEGEAKAVALLLMEKVCGLTVEAVLRGEEVESEEMAERLRGCAKRVAEGEPVQYVLGVAEFCGMEMEVEPGVLIPRKETEEMVEWVVEERQGKPACAGALRREEGLEGPAYAGVRVLDVGTGSGCIAVALARKLEGAKVEAWDVSEKALEMARRNAKKWSVEVEVKKVDVRFAATASHHTKQEREREGQEKQQGYLDVLVSNPPYVCESERGEMEANVVEHEPHVALFVPDEDPLYFYRRIAEIGLQLLRDGGMLFFEINRRFGKEMVALLEGMGYHDVVLRKDGFGNDRMVKAIK